MLEVDGTAGCGQQLCKEARQKPLYTYGPLWELLHKCQSGSALQKS